jgi:hypothetical protein
VLSIKGFCNKKVLLNEVKLHGIKHFGLRNYTLIITKNAQTAQTAKVDIFI